MRFLFQACLGISVHIGVRVGVGVDIHTGIGGDISAVGDGISDDIGGDSDGIGAGMGDGISGDISAGIGDIVDDIGVRDGISEIVNFEIHSNVGVGIHCSIGAVICTGVRGIGFCIVTYGIIT